MRHLGHLKPRRSLIACGDAGQERNRALTILTSGRLPSRTVSSQTGTEVLSGGEPGESDHSRLQGGLENCLLPRKHAPEIDEETQ